MRIFQSFSIAFMAVLSLVPSAASPQDQPATAVTGIVVDADTGAPIPGVTVFGPSNFGRPLTVGLIQREVIERRSVTQTGPDGRFVLEGPGEGSVSIGFEKSGFLPKSLLYSLKAGVKIEAQRIALSRSGTISGRVLDARGQPAVDFTITAYRYRDSRGSQQLISTNFAKTDDKGEFRLTDLQPNRYLININFRPTFPFGTPQERWSTNPNDGRFSTFHPGAREVENAEFVEVAGNEVRLRDVVISPANRHGRVRLRLLRERETPDSVGVFISHITPSVTYQFLGAGAFGGGTVESGPVNGVPEIISTSSDVTRDYWLPGPGVYEVRWTDSSGRNSLSSTRFEFTGRDIDVEFVLAKPAATVDVHLLPESGGGLIDLSKVTPVFCANEGPEWCLPLRGKQAVLPDGSIRVSELPYGTLNLSLSGPYPTGVPPDTYVSSARQGERDVLREGVLLEEGPTSRVDIRIARGVCSVKVQVFDRKGTPVRDVVIALNPAEILYRPYFYQRTARTDQDGNAEFKEVRPGDYRVQLNTGSKSIESSDFATVRLAPGETRTVKLSYAAGIE